MRTFLTFAYCIGLAVNCAIAHSAQPSSCPPDKYFQPFDSSETPYDQPSSEFSTELRKARRGDPIAQYNVGLSYDYGYLVTPCADRAKFWYRKAATRGNSTAENRLKFLACREALFPDSGRTVIFSVNLCGDEDSRLVSSSGEVPIPLVAIGNGNNGIACVPPRPDEGGVGYPYAVGIYNNCLKAKQKEKQVKQGETGIACVPPSSDVGGVGYAYAVSAYNKCLDAKLKE